MKRLILLTALVVILAALTSLNDMTWLYLGNTQISDISPLVLNEGRDTGDYINLLYNPLSSDFINIHIPELQVRGVTADY